MFLAMLLSSLPAEHSSSDSNENDVWHSLNEKNDFENTVDKEGFQGFIVRKFPQRVCLGSKVTKEHTSLTGAVSRREVNISKQFFF